MTNARGARPRPRGWARGSSRSRSCAPRRRRRSTASRSPAARSAGSSATACAISSSTSTTSRNRSPRPSATARDLGARVRYSWESPVLGSAGGPRHALPLLLDAPSPSGGAARPERSDFRPRQRRHAHRCRSAGDARAAPPHGRARDDGADPQSAARTSTAASCSTPTARRHRLHAPRRPAEPVVSLHRPASRRGGGVPAARRRRARRIGPRDLSGADGRAGPARSGASSATPPSTTSARRRISCRPRSIWPRPTAGPIARAGAATPRSPPPRSVTRSVLWDDVTVGAGAVLTECIVADGVDVPDGRRLDALRDRPRRRTIPRSPSSTS